MNDETPKTNLPVNWETELATAAKAAAAAERPALTSISLRSGVMMYEKVAVPGNKLDAIVVASMKQRLFYKDRFDPNNPASPVCFAFHDGTDNVPWIPHEKSHEKQSDACVTCPRNEWGSDLGGGRGKACKEVRKLAIIPSVTSKEMALINVPVMSVKNWSNYVNGVAASAKRTPWGVVTEIKVVPDPRTQFKVQFEPVRPLADDELPGVYAKIGLATEVLTTPYNYQNPQETMGSRQDGPEKKKKY